MKSIKSGIITAIIGLALTAVKSLAMVFPPEYKPVQQRLQQGWNTWDSRSILRWVHLPSKLAVNVGFKQQRWLDETFLNQALIGSLAPGAASVRPGLHAHDGSYLEFWLEWQELSAYIQAAHQANDLIIMITPLKKSKNPVKLVISLGLPWNSSGILSLGQEQLLAECGDTRFSVRVNGKLQKDPYVPLQTPYLVTDLDEVRIISSGLMPGSAALARQIIDQAKNRWINACRGAESVRETVLAIESAIAWNTVYEPRHDRVVSTVGRLWNEEYGGYCLFGWDNFFLAYLAALFHDDLALANVMEHLTSQTEEGFIPNDHRGNGSKSFDRSQPPVGSLMVKEIYKKIPKLWLLQAAYPVLLQWNRWWPQRRQNGELLSYGSHPAINPFHEPHTATGKTAGYESGMDDSPMYQDVPFNSQKFILELQDVGLTSLYIADCQALQEMALLLGKKTDAAELGKRAQQFAKALNTIWSDTDGYYLNRRSDTGQFSLRRSPTLFYPLLTRSIPKKRIQRLMDHFYNPLEFYGEYMLPSISRDDVDFSRQRYWKGAIWPPLNFLCYLGLRLTGQTKAAAELAAKSERLFLQEWRQKGLVGENYSAITGAGDEAHLSSDRFHSWGALLGIMNCIEHGLMVSPETALSQTKIPAAMVAGQQD
jgi:glycogen debranching enzyme